MSLRPAIGAAFDTGRIRRSRFDAHQLYVTNHVHRLEEDYRIMREQFGMTVFRDGVSMEQMRDGDWSYLDRLANVSRGQVWLSIFHYDWPPGTTTESFMTGHYPVLEGERLASEIATRYRGVFPVYFPAVEIGYWAAMMGTHKQWWPANQGVGGNWWEFFRVLARMTAASAAAILVADPAAQIAMSEPWLRCELTAEELARPFRTLLGMVDPMLNAELGACDIGGSSSLLHLAGLNCYSPLDPEWLREARRVVPEPVRLILAETGNCHHPLIPAKTWMNHTLEVIEESGVNVEAVFWAPAVTIADFDTCQPAPGALLSRSREIISPLSRPRRRPPAAPHPDCHR